MRTCRLRTLRCLPWRVLDIRFGNDFLRYSDILRNAVVQLDDPTANNEPPGKSRDLQDGGDVDDLVEGDAVDDITIRGKNMLEDFLIEDSQDGTNDDEVSLSLLATTNEETTMYWLG